MTDKTKSHALLHYL